MKLPKKWLNEFVDVAGIDDREYAHKLTMSGSIVEGISDLGAGIDRVVLGRLIEVNPHPNADKLSVCVVDVGADSPLTIVTGAKNVRSGDLVPVALVGSTLPNGTQINLTTMRGIDSAGMLCSFQELGLTLNNLPGANPDGILILNDEKLDLSPERYALGDSILPVLGLDEVAYEFEITSNRPDCLSVIGLARETAAVFNRPLRLHPPVIRQTSGSIEQMLSVEIRSPLCRRYAARVITDVKIASSPRWLRERLHAAGVRPINNLVDITNYVMLEYGQPMHAFDYSCLQGKAIRVRTAEAGEAIQTLDGNDRALTEGMLLICDGEKPIAVAGVMGGGNSEITDATQTIVFESANFDGPSVRRTAIALGMRTESSARFEKGLDPESVLPALERACELVELLGAGKVIDGVIDENPVPYQAKVLPLEPDKINALLGTNYTQETMEQVLTVLGFSVDHSLVTVPSWRGDVERMADLAEEVARLTGYDAIPMTPLGGSAMGGLTKRQKNEKYLAELCRAMGYSEIITYSFISPSAYDKIRMPAEDPMRDSLAILNPLGEDTGIMRTVSLPSMLETVSRNFNSRNASARLSELATVYRKTGGKLPEERKILTLGAYGEMDFFRMKGEILAIFSALRILDPRFEQEKNHSAYHPGQCAVVSAGGNTLGHFGQIHPLVLANYGIEVPVFVAELDLEFMFAAMRGDPEYQPTPRFPATTRDLAVLCDRAIPAGALEQTIRSAGSELLESVSIFDVYTGGQIPEQKKSVAFSLIFRRPDRTLQDMEVNAVFEEILRTLDREHGAILR